MKIAIASDHAGFEMKEKVKDFLKEIGHEFKDFGTKNKEPVDYPDFAFKVASAISKNECERGILLCETGLGMSIAANKISGIRAVSCYDVNTARLSREHNDANVLTLGARIIEFEKAKEIINVWLNTEFLGERHARRVEKIKEIENKVKKW
jgi:ribose 5-phosphate isomerase B